LRLEVDDFDGVCLVARASARDAHNRYYELAQRALRVEHSLRDVSRGLADLDSIALHLGQAEHNRQL
jgi:hypothetical protein